MTILKRLSQIMVLACACLQAPSSVQAHVDVLTQHNDLARSGSNPRETRLKTSNVNKAQFGKLCFRLVDGNVYAQPLIVSKARIDKRTDNPNALIVATEHNSVFALDAEDTDQHHRWNRWYEEGPLKVPLG
jgi:hypothetical protein